MSFFEELAVIADKLDKAGFYKEAAELDEELQKEWDRGPVAPGQMTPDKDMGAQGALMYLKNYMAGLDFDAETIDKINKVIDTVSAEIHNKSPYKERMDRARQRYFMHPKIIPMVEAIATLTREDLVEIPQEIQSLLGPDGNPEPGKEVEYQAKVRDLEKAKDSINEFRAIISQYYGEEGLKATDDYVNSTLSGARDVFLVPERRDTEDRRGE